MTVAFKESTEFDDATKRVSFRFIVTEGPRYFMGNLIINGLSPEDVERLKTKWTLGSNAVFDESYIDDFRKAGLREFMMGMVQRSPSGPRVKVEMETKPNALDHTVDVIISFK